MRVLYVEAASGFGGSLTGLLHLFRALPEGVEPVLVTPFDPLRYTELPPGVQHRRVEIPIPLAPKASHWLPGLLRYYRTNLRPWGRAIARLVDEFRPDLIHANNSVSLNYAAGLVGSRRRVPAISHQKTFEHPGRLTRHLLRSGRFAHHIGTSGAVTRHLVELGLPGDRCATLYEPVIGPAADALGPPRDQRSGPPVVAMHSMLTWWKGQHVFLEALAELRRRGVDGFRPVIAGDAPAGEVEYSQRLTRMTRDLGLDGWVEFVGHQRDVYRFLADVDVAVHAATEREPFGRVAAEAMLAAAPTIVARDGGPAEYVQDGQTGLHVSRGDHVGLADAIQRLLESPAERRRLGDAGREFARREFDPHELACQTVALYERVLAGEPSGRVTSANTSA